MDDKVMRISIDVKWIDIDASSHHHPRMSVENEWVRLVREAMSERGLGVNELNRMLKNKSGGPLGMGTVSRILALKADPHLHVANQIEHLLGVPTSAWPHHVSALGDDDEAA